MTQEMLTQTRPSRIAIIGTVGVPANYGGFETLAENLALWHESSERSDTLTVYCSGKAYADQAQEFHGAKLVYIPLQANGAQSIPYDIWSMLSAWWRGTDKMLILGVSGALFLPLLRMFSRAKIVTNIDGIEWKRDKWSRLQRAFLKWSEALAVRFSHQIIADNAAIADYVNKSYGVESAVIAYGGDHALAATPVPTPEIDLPPRYALKICRIEPENNIDMVLEAFAGNTDLPLVFIGNWDRSPYGAALKARYAETPGLYLVDPIYDIGKLRTLRQGATVCVHGHSAGGTNPSLVEMMVFGLPVFAYDCAFNRASTEDQAMYFQDAKSLRALVAETPTEVRAEIGATMKTIADARYTWNVIGQTYFDLL